MILGLLTLVLGLGATLAIPFFIGYVVDAMGRKDMSDINFYCFWMGVICIFSAIMSGTRAFTFNTLSEKIGKMIKYDLFMSLINQDIGFFDETKTGEILSRISSDT
tara:strand:- start:307 stop:624 length:318 start_codon:yes stop_codon:yes gene_type:complete